MDDKDYGSPTPLCLSRVQIPLWTIRTCYVAGGGFFDVLLVPDSSMDDKDYDYISRAEAEELEVQIPLWTIRTGIGGQEVDV